MNHHFHCIPLVAAILVSAATLPAQIVQLRNGNVLLGQIEGEHEGGFVLRRLDNGGELELTWDQLSEESAGKIKALFGLSLDDDGEVLVSVELLKYEISGGVIEQVIGRIVDGNDVTITVRRLGVNYPISRQQIRRRETIEVPATDVFTADEFYNEKLNEIAPGDDADKHIALGEILMRVRDYARARAHFEKAEQLGNSRQPNALAGKIKRLERFEEAQVEREHLDRIQVALARGEFTRGRELVEEFAAKYPNSKLASEFERTKDRFEAARERHLINRMVELWSKTAFALAQKKATTSGFGFDEAREYAESQLGQDIRARLLEVLDIDRDELETLWRKRLELRSLRAQRYDYGVGSWTLGADKVIEGTKQGGAEQEQEVSEEELRRRRQEDRVRRAIERARRANSQPGNRASEEETPNQWWSDATVDERIVWLRAYYAEFGGDLQVTAAYVNNCLVCAGEGSLVVFSQAGGQSQKVECTTCHGTRFRRWIRAQ